MVNENQLIADYCEAASGTADHNPKNANRWHDKMHACYKVLRQSEAGRKLITSQLSHEDPYVRGWAAAHSLQWAPEAARGVLEALQGSSDWRLVVDAEMTLREYDKGRLSFDY